MSFQQKSTWIMLAVFLAVYGWYFIKVGGSYLEGVQPEEIGYRGLMLTTVISLVVISIIAHIVISMFGPDDEDERDAQINRIGEYIGGYVATAAALLGMGMAMFEQDHFLIANAILLGLVLSELVSASIKLFYYHRGF